MKKLLLTFISLFVFFVCGCSSNSDSNLGNAVYEKGYAAFYTIEENGTLTSNNTRYNRNELTAAHSTLPYNTKIKVTNLNNGRSAYLNIIDHNMPEGDYIIKLSEKAASELAASNEHEFSIDIVKWG